MLIYMLATAMTVAMLIATAFGLHSEAERVRVRTKRFEGFGARWPTVAPDLLLVLVCAGPSGRRCCSNLFGAVRYGISGAGLNDTLFDILVGLRLRNPFDRNHLLAFGGVED
ncbi:hypothetical protein, partial [Mesorhizobium sp. C268A]|uniref:hypothetical protein n=1 Tax=Mesorhizobium sp. C268A TaxID=2956826 RepID=UPI00333C8114